MWTRTQRRQRWDHKPRSTEDGQPLPEPGGRRGLVLSPEFPEGTSPAGILTSDFRPPEPGGNNCPFSGTEGGVLVMAALGS